MPVSLLPPAADLSGCRVSREVAILHLVQQLCAALAEEDRKGTSASQPPPSSLSGSNPRRSASTTRHRDPAPPISPPMYYESLVAGDVMYRILHKVAPHTFTDVDMLEAVEDWVIPSPSPVTSPVTSPMSPKSSGAAVSSPPPPPPTLRPISPETQTIIKANLMALIRHMNDHARFSLDASRQEFNFTAMVNVNTVVRRCTTSCCVPTIPSSFASSASSPKASVRKAEKGKEDGDADGMGEEEKETAQDAGWSQFAVMTQLFVAMIALSGVPTMVQCLKSLDREEQRVLSNLTRDAMQAYGLKTGRQSVDRRGSAMNANRFVSPFRGMGVGGSQTSMLSDVSGGGSVAQGGGGGVDYRMKAFQLEDEIKEWKSRSQTFESQFRLLEEEKKNWDYKYKKLLQEVEKEPTQDLAALQASVAQKNEAVEALRAKVVEQQEAVSATKHAYSVLQLQNENQKRKLKQQEEVMGRLMEDRQELENKAQLAEDKLEVRKKVCQDLELEVEGLQNELKLLQLSKQKDGNGEDGEEGGLLVRNASFTSTGSVGRTVGLEKALREVRLQRDNYRKQIQVLQRQFAVATANFPGAGSPVPFLRVGSSPARALPHPSSSTTTTTGGGEGGGGAEEGSMTTTANYALALAACDTLKAQLRQSERERHDQKQQLKEATRRIQQLEEKIEQEREHFMQSTEVAQTKTKEEEAAAEGRKENMEGTTTQMAVKDEKEDLHATREASSVATAVHAPVSSTSDTIRPSMSPMTPAHLSVLISLLYVYGYQNMQLQHHDLLLFADRQVGYLERIRQESVRRNGMYVDHWHQGIGMGKQLMAGQRRIVEQGLLESTVHHYVSSSP